MESEGSPEGTNYVHVKANGKMPQMIQGELNRHKLRINVALKGFKLNKQITYLIACSLIVCLSIIYIWTSQSYQIYT